MHLQNSKSKSVAITFTPLNIIRRRKKYKMSKQLPQPPIHIRRRVVRPTTADKYINLYLN